MEDRLGAYSFGMRYPIRTLHYSQHTLRHRCTLIPKYCQLFLGTVVGYSDGQAYGFAALFGLVEDLKLFTATIVDGHLVLDTSKYQLTSGITSLGGAAVSIIRKHPLITEETLTTHQRATGTISASVSGTAPTGRHCIRRYVDVHWPYGPLDYCLSKLCADNDPEVCPNRQ